MFKKLLALLNKIERMIFMFNKDSALVQIWASFVLAGVYSFAQCPNLSNLREQVAAVLLDMGYDVNQTQNPA
ncbi:hypothetical protein [Petroclostridium sp. X23]|uniref:hypothetical protein n=1 Tax=Petroclostridium sp. X23 TaxID=3045146 RepID=UPI0024AD3139|nr:hypothetical protein [Petroclostridium sp. X23]WHH59175.1 hypothetical protein QKW49_25875 [Petroclostridium sp. X23]